MVGNPEDQFIWSSDQLRNVIRKPAICKCKNKDGDQLRGNRTADQLHWFCKIESTIPKLPKPEISSLWPSSVFVLPGLCRTWLATPKTGFLITQINLLNLLFILLYTSKHLDLSTDDVLYLSRVNGKSDFRVSDPVKYKSDCIAIEDG